MQAGAQPPQRPRPWLNLTHGAEVGVLHQLGEEVHQLIQLFDWGLLAFLAGLILCSRRDTLSASSQVHEAGPSHVAAGRHMKFEQSLRQALSEAADEHGRPVLLDSSCNLHAAHQQQMQLCKDSRVSHPGLGKRACKI